MTRWLPREWLDRATTRNAWRKSTVSTNEVSVQTGPTLSETKEKTSTVSTLSPRRVHAFSAGSAISVLKSLGDHPYFAGSSKNWRSVPSDAGDVSRLTANIIAALTNTPASAESRPRKYGEPSRDQTRHVVMPPSIEAMAPARVARRQFSPTTTGMNRKLTMSFAAQMTMKFTRSS